MCGIAGFAATSVLGPDERHRAQMMRDVLAHRGPDGAGLWADEHAALAHRRLSIVDLAGGHQPLSNEDRRDLGHVQRRDLQPRRRSRRARSCGTSVPHAFRHRNHRPRLRAVGRRVRAAVPRHVRVRALGRAAPAAAAGPRPAGRQAAVLGAGRRPRCSSRPRSRRFSKAGSIAAAAEQPRAVGSAGDALHRRHRDAVRGDPQAAPRPPAGLRARARADREVLGPAARRTRSGARTARRARR